MGEIMPKENIYTKDERDKIKNKYQFGKCSLTKKCKSWLTLTVNGDLWCNTGCEKSVRFDADRMFFDPQLKLAVPRLRNGHYPIKKAAWKRANDPRNVDIANKNKPINIPNKFLKASQDAVKEKSKGVLGSIKKAFTKSDDKPLSEKDLEKLIREHNDLNNFEMPKTDAQLAADFTRKEREKEEQARLERDKNRTPEQERLIKERHQKALLKKERPSQIYGQ